MHDAIEAYVKPSLRSCSHGSRDATTTLHSRRLTRSAGRESHVALELNIVRIYAPRMGDYAFYVQETAADDPRRVIHAARRWPSRW